MEWSLLFGKVGSANMDLSSVKLKNPRHNDVCFMKTV